ncbi:MAG: hypothetical protein ABIY52_09025 [Gemmatimonadaceae bacterium]
MFSFRPLLALAAVLAIACGDHDADDHAAAVPMNVSRNAGTGGGSVELGSGDVRITNRDGGVDLALIGDSISGGLSEKTLAKVRSDIDTTKVKGTGFGADIEKMVKGTVQSALTTRVAYPLSAVKDVRYENGKIVFEWNGKAQSFGKVNVDGKDVLESFSESEAKRFVDAVHARKGSATAQ